MLNFGGVCTLHGDSYMILFPVLDFKALGIFPKVMPNAPFIVTASLCGVTFLLYTDAWRFLLGTTDGRLD